MENLTEDIESIERPIPFECDYNYLVSEKDCVIEHGQNICYTCPQAVFMFTTGEPMFEIGTLGHLFLSLVGFLVVFVSLSGVFGNFLVIKVMSNRPKNSFNTLVTVLAIVDIVCCISSVLSLVPITAGPTHGWIDTGNPVYLTLALIVYNMFYLSRELSIFIMMIIACGRYFAVSSPHQYQKWNSSKAVTIQILVVFSFVSYVFIPDMILDSVVQNTFCNDSASPTPNHCSFDYVIVSEDAADDGSLSRFIRNLGYDIMIYLPVPLMTVVSVISFLKIRHLNEQRNRLCSSVRDELRPARMFLPVLIFFLISYIADLTGLILEKVYTKTFVDIVFLEFLGASSNSAVNFILYYASSSRFRKDVANISTLFRKTVVTCKRDLSVNMNTMEARMTLQT